MAQEEMSYEELRSKVIAELKNPVIGTLATSEAGYVTARVLGFISDGLTLYCFVGVSTRKCTQINANPNVAVTSGKLQIEGTAIIRGEPLAEENKHIIDLFKRTVPDMYEIFLPRWSPKAKEASRVIEVTSQRVAVFENGMLEILYVDREKAYRVPLVEVKDSPAYYEK